MRRWFWPYAILAVVLSLIAIATAAIGLSGGGIDRLGAQFSVANTLVVEPVARFMGNMLEMISPVDLPDWFKQLYTTLVFVAIAGVAVSVTLGVVLLPVFYALYRSGDD